MNLYLASYKVSMVFDETHYQLIKADSKDSALKKLKNKINRAFDIEIEEPIE